MHKTKQVISKEEAIVFTIHDTQFAVVECNGKRKRMTDCFERTRSKRGVALFYRRSASGVFGGSSSSHSSRCHSFPAEVRRCGILGGTLDLERETMCTGIPRALGRLIMAAASKFSGGTMFDIRGEDT